MAAVACSQASYPPMMSETVSPDDVGNVDESGLTQQAGRNGRAVPTGAVDDRRGCRVELRDPGPELTDRKYGGAADRSLLGLARVADVDQLESVDALLPGDEVNGGQA